MENDIDLFLEDTTVDTTNTTLQDIDTNTVTLETIHNDLGFICSFLVIAAVVVFMTILYRFFSMFF